MRGLLSFATAFAMAEAGKADRECQMPEVQQNFDVEAYTGIWYEQRRDKDCYYESGICDTATYSIKNETTLRVLNNDYVEDTDKWRGGAVNGVIVDPSKHEGYLKITFLPFVPGGDYKILGTDYESYTVLYTCLTYPIKSNLEFVWILTRDPNPSDDVMNTALDVIRTKIPLYDMS